MKLWKFRDVGVPLSFSRLSWWKQNQFSWLSWRCVNRFECVKYNLMWFRDPTRCHKSSDVASRGWLLHPSENSASKREFQNVIQTTTATETAGWNPTWEYGFLCLISYKKYRTNYTLRQKKNVAILRSPKNKYINRKKYIISISRLLWCRSCRHAPECLWDAAWMHSHLVGRYDRYGNRGKQQCWRWQHTVDATSVLSNYVQVKFFGKKWHIHFEWKSFRKSHTTNIYFWIPTNWFSNSKHVPELSLDHGIGATARKMFRSSPLKPRWVHYTHSAHLRAPVV